MKNKKYSIVGIIFTIIITICFIWSMFQMSNNELLFRGNIEKIKKRNEIDTYNNLKKIIEAQDNFMKQDWNNDGIFSYAEFLVHLWKTFDQNGEPVKVDLIPKKLAFAMGTTRTISGYYFLDIRSKEIEKKESIKLDYQKEWAIAAFPAEKDSGELIFMVGVNKNIYAQEKTGFIDTYPSDPEISGWEKIEKISQIGD